MARFIMIFDRLVNADLITSIDVAPIPFQNSNIYKLRVFFASGELCSFDDVDKVELDAEYERVKDLLLSSDDK